MSTHLTEAKSIASIADAVSDSPDARSVPTLLGGILHALTGLLENVEEIRGEHDRDEYARKQWDACDAALGRVIDVADELDRSPNATLKPVAFPALAKQIRDAINGEAPR